MGCAGAGRGGARPGPPAAAARRARVRHEAAVAVTRAMLDIKSSADYLSRSGPFTNFSMLFAGEYQSLYYRDVT